MHQISKFCHLYIHMNKRVVQSETTPCWLDKRSIQTFCHPSRYSEIERKKASEKGTLNIIICYMCRPHNNASAIAIRFHILLDAKIGKVKCERRSQTSQFPFNLLLASVAGCRLFGVHLPTMPAQSWFTSNSPNTRLKYKQNYTNLWCLFDSTK